MWRRASTGGAQFAGEGIEVGGLVEEDEGLDEACAGASDAVGQGAQGAATADDVVDDDDVHAGAQAVEVELSGGVARGVRRRDLVRQAVGALAGHEEGLARGERERRREGQAHGFGREHHVEVGRQERAQAGRGFLDEGGLDGGDAVAQGVYEVVVALEAKDGGALEGFNESGQGRGHGGHLRGLRVRPPGRGRRRRRCRA